MDGWMEVLWHKNNCKNLNIPFKTKTVAVNRNIALFMCFFVWIESHQVLAQLLDTLLVIGSQLPESPTVRLRLIEVACKVKHTHTHQVLVNTSQKHQNSSIFLFCFLFLLLFFFLAPV